jgi:hypothetical protein
VLSILLKYQLKEIPEQVDSLAKKYEELGGDKEELVHRIQD